jgi:hypothetical protein
LPPKRVRARLLVEGDRSVDHLSDDITANMSDNKTDITANTSDNKIGRIHNNTSTSEDDTSTLDRPGTQ